MDNFKEWHPDGATIIVGEQTIVNPISLKLCCSKIIANVGNPIAYRGEAFICTQLDELLNKSVGVVTPSLGTMFGAENKAFQNTVERPKMAFLVADKVKLFLADKLSPQAKEIAFRAVDVWLDGVTAGDRQSAACTVHKNPSISRELPSELDTEQARKYFARAVAAGLMSEQFEWLATKAQLGYFCYKTYSQPRPLTVLERFFDVKKLSSDITNASIEAKRADVKKWRARQDKEIFFD
jgi:hypothetical protein